MGAFDSLSDDDPRVIAHEEGKLLSKYGKSLSEYSDLELKNEIARRANERKEKIKKAKVEIEARRKAEKESFERRKAQIYAKRNERKVLDEIQALNNKIEQLKQRLPNGK